IGEQCRTRPSQDRCHMNAPSNLLPSAASSAPFRHESPSTNRGRRFGFARLVVPPARVKISGAGGSGEPVNSFDNDGERAVQTMTNEWKSRDVRQGFAPSERSIVQLERSERGSVFLFFTAVSLVRHATRRV